MRQGRQAFDREIHDLEHDLLEMGSRAETMIANAAEALAELDTALAMQVIQSDDMIDDREIALEAQCLRLLALHQPMASDLRLVGAVIKILTDVERIADLAVDVAKIALKVDAELGSSGAIDIRRMTGVARTMFREALVAFARRDLARVETVAQLEDEVDAIYRELRGQIFADMADEGSNAVCNGWLLMAIHHIERIADHAMNIAERVGFMVTGELRSLDRSPG